MKNLLFPTPNETPETQSEKELSELLRLANIYSNIYEFGLEGEPTKLMTFKEFKQKFNIDNNLPKRELQKFKAIYKRYKRIQRYKEKYDTSENKFKELELFNAVNNIQLEDEFYRDIQVAFGPLSIDFFITRKAFNAYLEKIQLQEYKEYEYKGFSPGIANLIVIDDEHCITNINQQDKPIDITKLKDTSPQLYSTLVHERQHSIYQFFKRKNHFLTAILLGAKQNKLFKNFLEFTFANPRIAKFIEKYITELLLESTKDELLSLLAEYFEGLNQNLINQLFQNLQLQINQEKRALQAYHAWADNLELPTENATRIVEKHNEVLRSALTVIQTLSQANYHVNQILGLLSSISIYNWEKTVGNILNDSNNRRDKYN